MYNMYDDDPQVATIGGQQLIQSSSGQQFLIVNKSLQSSGGRIQIVNQEPQEHTTAKEILGEGDPAKSMRFDKSYSFRCCQETGNISKTT